MTDAERFGTLDAEHEFAARVAGSLRSFGILSMDGPRIERQTRTADLRLRRSKRFDDAVGILTLTDEDGVLRWRVGSGAAPARPAGRRAAGGRLGSRARVIEQFKFEDVEPNRIGQKLVELDQLLTGAQGLFSVDGKVLAELEKGRTNVSFGEAVRPRADGRILLFVHGTFSNCEQLLTELAGSPQGVDLLKTLVKGERYGQVLAFNHPTLSVSPLLNAVELARLFRGSAAEVDVICHSRGGLVTRAWLELLDERDAGRGRVIFAGSPLAGTSLAAPARLKASLDVLTNLSKALSAAVEVGGAFFPLALPYGQAAMALMSLFGKVTELAVQSPLLDAGVSLIPGLAAQSRQGANAEILALRRSFSDLSSSERKRYLERYYFLRSNFESEDPGWRFWRYFRKSALADRAADVIFDAENDLVVDSASMCSLADDIGSLHAEHVCDLSGKKTVHHLNYFRQPEVVSFLRQALMLGES